MLEPAAVLWDLDGTLVDTEPIWIGAETELAASHGYTWTHDDAMELVGSDLLVSGETIRRKIGTDMAAEDVVEFLVERVIEGLSGAEVPWRPGALDLIDGFASAGVPQALVTMSYERIAAPLAAALPFEAVVTGDAVPRGKPHPDPYLLAAERLGVDPTTCLAIEDSPTGALSAQAAGCHVVVVPHLLPVPTAERQVQVATLADQTTVTLANLF